MIAAFFAGAFVTFVIAAVFFGTVTKAQAERIRTLQAIIFGLEQDILHLDEGNDDRIYHMRSNGVEVEVVRGRPDLPKNRSDEPTHSIVDGPEIWHPEGKTISLTHVFGEDTFDE